MRKKSWLGLVAGKRFVVFVVCGEGGVYAIRGEGGAIGGMEDSGVAVVLKDVAGTGMA